MIRLLFLAQLPPPVHGASLMSRYLLDGLLNDSSYEVVPLNISTANSLERLGKPSIQKLFLLMSMVMRLLTILLSRRIDIVYITLSPTGSAFFKDALLLLIAKLFISRRVIHLHGKGIKDKMRGSVMLRFFYEKVFSGCEVIHLSQGLLSDLDGLAYKKSYVVPNGAPLHLEETRTEKRYDFIYLSNIIESKGYFVFLESLGELKSKGLKFKAAVIGAARGSDVEVITNSIVTRFDLNACIDFLGPRFGNEKYAVLQDSHTFVLPTFYKNECFPLSILEAMSVGLCVISTEEGAIPEIIDDGITGIIVERQSVSSLSAAMTAMLVKPSTAAKMGRMGKEKFVEYYSLDAFFRNMHMIFKQ